MKILGMILLLAGTAQAKMETETLRCLQANTTTFYKFEAPPIESDKYFTDDQDLRELSCTVTAIYGKDERFGIHVYSKGPDKSSPGVCWKSIARQQLEGAQCCFENATGTLTRPWLVCGTKGNKAKMRQAKKTFVIEQSKRYGL